MILMVVALLFGLTQVTGGDDPAAVSSPTSVATSVAQPAVAVSVPTPAPGAEITGPTPCPEIDGSSPRTTSFEEPPPTCIDHTFTYAADIVTTKGVITVTLDDEAAAATVNNFVVLARYRFFDTLPFHRIEPGFVIQTGSPDATLAGDPGYRFDDELPEEAVYEVGTVAMANSGPDSNGSQFFIVVGDASHLPPSYTVFGRVSGGMDVVEAIAAAGLPPGHPDAGAPTEVITIETVTIKEA